MTGVVRLKMTAAQDSQQSKRGRGRPKGSKASELQKSKLDEGRAKAIATTKARKARRRQQRADGVMEKPRWQKLRDGELTVKDLTDDELIKREVANDDLTWYGRRGPVSERHLNAMEAERIRRLKRKVFKLGDKAADALEELLDDHDSPAVRLAATKFVLEHNIGKVPDVVHVGVETAWDRLGQTGFVVARGSDDDIDPGDFDDGKSGTVIAEEAS